MHDSTKDVEVEAEVVSWGSHRKEIEFWRKRRRHKNLPLLHPWFQPEFDKFTNRWTHLLKTHLKSKKYCLLYIRFCIRSANSDRIQGNRKSRMGYPHFYAFTLLLRSWAIQFFVLTYFVSILTTFAWMEQRTGQIELGKHEILSFIWGSSNNWLRQMKENLPFWSVQAHKYGFGHSNSEQVRIFL